MQLKLLCVGDLVGTPGRRALRQGIETLVPKHKIDCVIVNAENAAGGSGITPAIYEKILHYGADLVTLGDHIYRRREIIPVLETHDQIVRPANLPTSAPGKKFAIHETASSHKIAVVSLLGRVFMNTPVGCPYATVDQVLSSIPRDVKIVVIDMHAEATSEKIAMGWHLDGRVSLVFGTHTHVPTADERVLPGGTAYISDLGMTGPYDSVLGRVKENVLRAMMTAVPSPFDVASNDVRLCGIIVSVDADTGRAVSIERVTFDAAEEE